MNMANTEVRLTFSFSNQLSNAFSGTVLCVKCAAHAKHVMVRYFLVCICCSLGK